jgi:hypothetical protein
MYRLAPPLLLFLFKQFNRLGSFKAWKKCKTQDRTHMYNTTYDYIGLRIYGLLTWIQSGIQDDERLDQKLNDSSDKAFPKRKEEEAQDG